MSTGPRDCASSCPTTGSSSPNRASASRRLVARWRALGFDGALVGEALVRAADPAAAVRAFVAAGAAARRPGQRRAPAVRQDLRHHRRRRGPRGGRGRGGCDRAERRPGHAPRARARRGRGAGTAGPERRRLRSTSARRRDHRRRVAARASSAIVAALDPDVVQLSGTESVAAARAIPRRTWKVLHLPAEEPSNPSAVAADLVSRGRAYLAAGVERLFLDTAGGPHPGGTGTRAAERLAAAVAREVPVTLAGGLDPANVAGALRAIPAIGGRRRVRRRAPARPRRAAAQGSVPGRAVRQASPRRPRRSPERRRSARPRSMPACSTPTAPDGGGWSATSVAATCPRR